MTIDIYTHRLEETIVHGKRLGRHISHDPRNWQYPARGLDKADVKSVRWSTDDDLILDQGDIGSCPGESDVGALICSNNNPLHDGLSDEQKSNLGQPLALKVYELATTLDSFPGSYPPDDTGSDGPDAAKASTQMGYTNGFTHCFSVDTVVAKLATQPIMIGVSWHTGMDNPNKSGMIVPSGTVRGGHEITLDELNVEDELVWLRNSWSTSYGLDGRVCMTIDSLKTLLTDNGDATVLVALSAPAPVPLDPDATLVAAAAKWVSKERNWPPNERLRQNILAWEAAKGL